MKRSIYIFSLVSFFCLYFVSCGGGRDSKSDSNLAFEDRESIENYLIRTQDSIAVISKNAGITQGAEYDTTNMLRADSLLAVWQSGAKGVTAPTEAAKPSATSGTFYLPVNEQQQSINGDDNSDMMFEFYLPNALNTTDSVILSYKLKGVSDFTALAKRINDSKVVGGRFVKSDTVWREQTEELPYFALQRGKNTIRYQLPQGINNVVAIKDIQLRVVPKGKNRGSVVVNQPDNRSFYRTFGYLQGFVDGDVKLFIDGKEIRTIDGSFETLVGKTNTASDSDGSWSTTLEIRYPDGSVQQQDVKFRESIDYDFKSGMEYTAPYAEQSVYPDRGFEFALLGAKFIGGAGAVDNPTTLSVTALRSIDMSVVGSDIVNVTAQASGYRFLPDGTKFKGMQTMAIAYNPSMIPQGYTADDIFTFYYNETTRHWQRVERYSIDTVNHVIYSHTDHFTDYINGILKAPELPDVQAYTPTTIKDLQAAHPHTGIGQFSVPEANNKGTATTSMPLWLPAGRNGIQPNLNLVYNSAGGNGWLGQGWDIPFSSIEVETRWGVPLYDNNFETETYLLDGETLVESFEENNNLFLKKPTYRRSFENRIPDSVRLYRQVEGAFQKIMRYGSLPSEYYFVVTDKNGTKMIYGNDNTDNNSPCELKTGEGNKAKWYLTKIEDTNGNWVKFSYQSKKHYGGEQVYIKEIEYTGNGNEVGNYKIVFNLSDTIRPDITSNGRKGLFEVDAHLLDRVDVIYSTDNDTLRQYYFGYKAGNYGKTLLANLLDADSTFKTDMNFKKFAKKDIFDRNADRRETANYFPIKYFFEYHKDSDTISYSQDKTISVGTSDVNAYNTIGSSIIKSTFNLTNIQDGTLGGSTGKSDGIGGALNVGLGYLFFLKTSAAGGNYNYGYDQQSAFMTFVDLDGDGYPDKLFKGSDGKLQYRKLVVDQNNNSYFSDPTIINTNIRDFNKTTSNSHSFGLEAQFVAGVGVEANTLRSEISTYLSDIDGNGLVDIVDNDAGKVYFNKGRGNFSDETQQDTIWEGTPNPCRNNYVLNDIEINNDVFKIGGKVDTIIDTICVVMPPYSQCPYCSHYYQQGYLLEYRGCPHHSMVCHNDTFYIHEAEKELYAPDIQSVRAWIAPYSGKVNISGIASLSSNFKRARIENNVLDGVKLYIQTTRDRLPLVEKNIFPTVDQPDTVHMNYPILHVSEGQIIYFVTKSNSRHTFDVLNWSPTIKYLETNIYPSIEPAAIADNPSSFTFDAASDFVLNGINDAVSLPFDGDVKIEYSITGFTSATTDKLKLICEYYDNNGQNNTFSTPRTIFTRTTSVSTSGTHTTTISGLNDSTNACGYMRFYLDCDNKLIDWSKVDAKVKLYYTRIAPVNGQTRPVIQEITATNETIYTTERMPVVEKKFFHYAKQPSIRLTQNNNLSNSLINVKYTASNNPTGDLTMIMRDNQGRIIYKYDIYLPTCYGDCTTADIKIPPLLTSVYNIDFYIKDGDVAISNKIYNIRVIGNGVVLPAGYYVNYFDVDDNSPMLDVRKFRNVYRGWTQFGYKPAQNTYNYIDETLLSDSYLNNFYNEVDTNPPSNDHFDIDPNNFNIEDISSTTSGNTVFNPLNYNFFVMTADAKTGRYVSYANVGYIAKDTVSNAIITSQKEEDRIGGFPTGQVQEGEKAKTIAKRTRKDFPALSVRGSVSLGPVGISGSYSGSSSKVESDYLDLNGDRYPDVLSIGAVQYSKPHGGLSDKIVDFSANEAMKYADISSDRAGNASASAGKNITIPQKSTTSSVRKSVVQVKQTGGSVGAGIAVAFSQTEASWQDVNGDGLPDRVAMVNGVPQVFYNLGYSFTNGVPMAELTCRSSYSITKSSNFGANTAFDISLSISGGLSASKSDNVVYRTLMDVNNDGLVDIVEADNPTALSIMGDILGNNVIPFDRTSNNISVRYNRGGSFSEPIPLGQRGFSLGDSESSNFGGNVAATIGFTLGLIPLKIETTPSYNSGWSVTSEKSQFVDFNNDGLPDFVRVSPHNPNEIIVRYAIPKPINLLKTITSPVSMRTIIDYTLSEPSTPENPSRYWEMSKCEKRVVEKDTMYRHINTFQYANRKYDRFEREDYGYGMVKTNVMVRGNKSYLGEGYNINYGYEQCILEARFGTTWDDFDAVYMTQTDWYHTDNNMLKGLKYKSTATDATGDPISVEDNTYSYYEIASGVLNENNDPCLGGVYPAVKEAKNTIYEGTDYISTTKTYSYTSFGNVKTYTHNMGQGVSVSANMIYHNLQGKYVVGVVQKLTYSASNNSNTYSRLSKIDAKGNVVEIKSNNIATTNYAFDRYGNLRSVIYPRDGNGRRKWVNITYDNVLRQLPIKVRDIMNYLSTTEYDYRYQVPTKTVDIGGSVMLYRYDTKGRLKSIKTPKDPIYTVKYTYWDLFDMSDISDTVYPANDSKWVETSHYNQDYPTMPIKTVVFADGFGRIETTAKYIDITGQKPRQIAFTGLRCYDDVGNVVEEVAEPIVTDSIGTDGEKFVTNDNEISLWYFNTHEYIDGRPKYPKSVWVNRIYRRYKLDMRGRVIETIEPDGSRTTADYSIENGLLKTTITNANGDRSSQWKDVRGLTLKSVSPMGATTLFNYDGLGQLLHTQDPEGHITSFEYDIMGRTTKIEHPSRGTTQYTYCGATANVKKETNELGETTYEYDVLGRLTVKNYSENSQNDVYYEYGAPNWDYGAGRLFKKRDATGVTEYKYGSMGEVVAEARTHILVRDWITYVTVYSYDSWGRTREIIYPDGEGVVYRYNKAGLLHSVESQVNGTYITNVQYNALEQKVSITYGNGTIESFKYDTLMWRPTEHSLEGHNQSIVRKRYEYDPIGNVVEQEDFYNFAGNSYDITHKYGYDMDNRLQFAQGVSPNNSLSYDQYMLYSPAGAIREKDIQMSSIKNGAAQSYTYFGRYEYTSQSNPYAAQYVYDDNNNYTLGETLCWDRAGNLSLSTSNATGIKEAMYWTEDNRMQLYVRMGGDNSVAYYRYDDSGKREMKLLGKMLDVYNMGNSYNIPHFDDMVLYAGDLATFDRQGFKKHYFVEGRRFLTNVGSIGRPNIDPQKDITGNNSDLSDKFAQYLDKYFIEHPNSCDPYITEDVYSKLTEVKEIARLYRAILLEGIDNIPYYLHTDRLGSGTVVTDKKGEPVHVLSYMPYGETLLDLSQGFETPYQFAGYEKDSESGLSYAGARYYDSDLSIFNSTDPMWHKYPHLTPYHYCANNPVMRVDPDGMADDEWDINSKGEIVNHIKTDKHDAFYIVDDNGRRIDGKSISFEYGTIKNFKSQYSDKEKTKFDWYNVRGDENGTLLFECMSNNTEVEWSQFKVGKAGAKGLNFLTTSHSENMESAGVFLYNNLLRHKYFIREHIHNHPNGLPVPSGMPGTTQEGKGDISFVSVLNTNNRAHKYGAISYKIYSKGFGYNPYNENSQVGDFEYIYNRLGLRPKMK